VVITKDPCVLQYKVKKPSMRVDPEAVHRLQAVPEVSCIALSMEGEGDEKHSSIDPNFCVGCTVCAQVCKFDAILPGSETHGLGKASTRLTGQWWTYRSYASSRERQMKTINIVFLSGPWEGRASSWRARSSPRPHAPGAGHQAERGPRDEPAGGKRRVPRRVGDKVHSPLVPAGSATSWRGSSPWRPALRASREGERDHHLQAQIGSTVTVSAGLSEYPSEPDGPL